MSQIQKATSPTPCLKTNEAQLKILRTEIEYALKTMKHYKAVGLNQIPIELIKIFEYILLKRFNNIYIRNKSKGNASLHLQVIP